jgi:hypothetical protein
VLDIVGVHSPKFEHERDPVALAAAVERYGVAHPVLDDPDLVTWDQYAAKAWPTLSVVDPRATSSPRWPVRATRRGWPGLLDELIAIHSAHGTLNRGDGSYVPPPAVETALRFPAKAVVRPTGALLVADSAHHSVAEVDGGDVIRRIGSGQRGGPTGRPRWRRSRAERALPAAARGGPSGSATTSSSRTR